MAPRRLVRVSGVFTTTTTTTVDAVRLDKITDSTYYRSLPGRVLGYGTIRTETAGQHRTLKRMDLVPSPAAIYRATLR